MRETKITKDVLITLDRDNDTWSQIDTMFPPSGTTGAAGCVTIQDEERDSPSEHSNQALSALLTLHFKVADLMMLRESTGSSVNVGFPSSALVVVGR